jgi:hypothetical protein
MCHKRINSFSSLVLSAVHAVLLFCAHEFLKIFLCDLMCMLHKIAKHHFSSSAAA